MGFGGLATAHLRNPRGDSLHGMELGDQTTLVKREYRYSTEEAKSNADPDLYEMHCTRAGSSRQ
jgi:hypothetical protein